MLRRFQNKVEFLPFAKDERINMIEKFINSVNPDFLSKDVINYAEEPHTQAEIIHFLIEEIAKKIN